MLDRRAPAVRMGLTSAKPNPFESPVLDWSLCHIVSHHIKGLNWYFQPPAHAWVDLNCNIWITDPDKQQSALLAAAAYLAKSSKPDLATTGLYEYETKVVPHPEHDIAEMVRNDIASVRQPQGPATPEAISNRYVGKVRDIPEVQEVRLVKDEEGISLWTIISATPFDKVPRNRIYRAQIEILRDADRPIVDFRLINLNELPEASREHIVPRDSRIVWEKK